MAKRFMDTDLWQKDWFQELSCKYKSLYMFLVMNCDCAGVWDTNLRLATFIIGEQITDDDLLQFNKDKKRIHKLENGKYFLIDFIKFQYGELNPNLNPHKGVLKILEKYDILTLYKELGNPLQGVQDKDKDMDKDKYKDKDKAKDIFCNTDFQKTFNLYSENCKNLKPLLFEKRNRETLNILAEVLEEIDYDFEQFKELCIKANKLEKIVNSPIDFKSMLKNYIGIISGKYETGNVLDLSKIDFS